MAPLTRFTLKAALALAIVATLLAPLPASAQTLYGSITGTVSDQQGAAIPGATVMATNTGTGLQVSAVTDTDGNYTFRNLLPGIYDLNASLEGFRALNQTGLRVSAGNPVRVELKLEVGTLAETVNVVSETTLLQTEKADLSTELTSKEIVNLPLNQFRNYQKLIDLVPGATPVAVPERRDRHARPLAAHVGERHAAEQQRDPHRRRGVGQHLAAAPRGLRERRRRRSRPSTSRPTTSTPTRAWPAAPRSPSSPSPARTSCTARPSCSATTRTSTRTRFFNNAFGAPQAGPLRATSTAAPSAGRSSRTSCSSSGRGSATSADRQATTRHFGVPPRGCGRATSARWRRPTPASSSTTPYTGGAGGVGREQFPNYTIPGNLISPIATGGPGLLPAAQHDHRTSTRTRSPTTTVISARVSDRPRQLRPQADLPAQRPRTRSGPSSRMLDDEGVGQLHPRLRRAAASATPASTWARSATPGRSARASCSTATSASTGRTRR